MFDDELEPMPEVRQLSAKQRRVLGVLMEKASTTPEYYPLTLKALTTGCNQKNNRAPLVDYDEDTVVDTISELQKLGLVAAVYTEGGRAERYRHYVRKRYQFTPQQAAIMTELLLRGRQSLGDLRTRASRITPIEDLDILRRELSGLLEAGYVQAGGPLDRRGVEVDHGFYPPEEARRLQQWSPLPDEPVPAASRSEPRPATVSASVASAPASNVRSEDIEELRRQNAELRAEIATLRDSIESLSDRVDRLCRDLGV